MLSGEMDHGSASHGGSVTGSVRIRGERVDTHRPSRWWKGDRGTTRGGLDDSGGSWGRIQAGFTYRQQTVDIADVENKARGW